MKITIIDEGHIRDLQPVSCRESINQLKLAGKSVEEHLRERWNTALPKDSKLQFSTSAELWPSDDFLQKIAELNAPCRIVTKEGLLKAWISEDSLAPECSCSITIDDASLLIKYPWDLLSLCEIIVGSKKKNLIKGEIRDAVYIDGIVELGEGSVLLPGVFIEGNVSIGKNCKIGPNCHLRGNTSIGDNCHIGNAVEIKNSWIMDGVSAGHLTFIGDSIICSNCNLGAGTITSNLRHDKTNQRSEIGGKLIDTGRMKLGAVIGKNARTGIKTAIYPGRKIWPDLWTIPGEIVKKDLHCDKIKSGA